MKVYVSIQRIVIWGFPRSVPNQWPFVLGTLFSFCLISAFTNTERDKLISTQSYIDAFLFISMHETVHLCWEVAKNGKTG